MTKRVAESTAHRLKQLRETFAELEAASFLVTDPVNVRWLTGFSSSNAALLVTAREAFLFTDGRYIEAAEETAGVTAEQSERDVATYVGKRLEQLADPPLAIEADHVTVAKHAAIRAGGVELLETTRAIKRLRAVKDDSELSSIRQAGAIIDQVMRVLGSETLVERSETEVAWWVEQEIRNRGADGLSFEPIVASGPNAAVPHHHPSSRRIGLGETVIVDAGARVDGYCSDCTRTFVTGDLDSELRLAYDLCLATQQAALDRVTAGVRAADLDSHVRSEIEQSELAPVLHSLGHGVGLEVHELPVLSHVSDEVLEAGQVVTVEPGIYLAGRGGVRIEDLVVVTAGAPEVLTPVTKEPISYRL